MAALHIAFDTECPGHGLAPLMPVEMAERGRPLDPAQCHAMMA